MTSDLGRSSRQIPHAAYSRRSTPSTIASELLPEVAGLLVRSVEPGSPAAEAGIEPGDLLIAGNDRELRSSSALHAAVKEAGDGPLLLKLLRGSDEVRVRITLAEHEGRPRQLEATAPRGEHCV